jgi:Flp pilus assembly protein TadG
MVNRSREHSMMLMHVHSDVAASGRISSLPRLIAKATCDYLRAGSTAVSMVEFALVLPLLLLVLTGILLTGIAFKNYLTLTQAVNNAASDLQNGAKFILPGATDASYTDPCSLVTSKASGYAYGMDTSKITYSMVLNNTAIYPAESGTTDIAPQSSQSGTFSCKSAPPLQSNTWATVVVTYPCDLPMLNGLMSLVGGQALAACNLKATTTVQIL